MNFLGYRIFLILFLVFGGCTTAAPEKLLLNHPPARESAQETVSAVGSIAGAISGRELTEQDLRKVSRQIQNDREAKQAVERITRALSSPGVGVKYCPVDGRRYDARFFRCPDHDVLLKELEE